MAQDATAGPTHDPERLAVSPRPSGPPPIDDAELERRFTYHAPVGIQTLNYGAIRENALTFAKLIVDLSPASREQSLAITALEEAVMWANAAIARRS